MVSATNPVRALRYPIEPQLLVRADSTSWWDGQHIWSMTFPVNDQLKILEIRPGRHARGTSKRFRYVFIESCPRITAPLWLVWTRTSPGGRGSRLDTAQRLAGRPDIAPGRRRDVVAVIAASDTEPGGRRGRERERGGGGGRRSGDNRLIMSKILYRCKNQIMFKSCHLGIFFTCFFSTCSPNLTLIEYQAVRQMNYRNSTIDSNTIRLTTQLLLPASR